jgi:hypothetical protein
MGAFRRVLTPLVETVPPQARASAQVGFRIALKEIEKRLRKDPEPTPEELEKIRARSGDPDLLAAIRGGLRQMLATLPPAPRGRLPKLSEQERSKVPELIGKYVAQGKTMTEAMELLAREKKLSSRTIKRIWLEERTGKDGTEK